MDRRLMNKTTILLGGAAVVFLAAAGWIMSQNSRAQAIPVPTAPNIQAGQSLYGEYCASCHGANLEGQPDWRSPGDDGRLPAPPHDETGHTWHHPDQLLFKYTKLGGKAALASQGIEFDSGMPGFGEDLSDQDIWNILGFIRSTWPERQRQVQVERTKLDSEGEGN
ncbi:cytochrome c (plasmid) [Aliiroseovarius crassostreae]|uniref:Cytochrome c n=2 Tax=Aliiroseovarius crassostreae TaxID=154981 RepID=A0A9Q9HFW7_9RHOB|nr:cytochrome c [Aliiroseovarius crassostreae]